MKKFYYKVYHKTLTLILFIWKEWFCWGI